LRALWGLIATCNLAPMTKCILSSRLPAQKPWITVH
jgi:hypothetical protein